MPVFPDCLICSVSSRLVEIYSDRFRSWVVTSLTSNYGSGRFRKCKYFIIRLNVINICPFNCRLQIYAVLSRLFCNFLSVWLMDLFRLIRGWKLFTKDSPHSFFMLSWSNVLLISGNIFLCFSFWFFDRIILVIVFLDLESRSKCLIWNLVHKLFLAIVPVCSKSGTPVALVHII